MAVKVIERRRSFRHACIGDLPAPLLRANGNTPLTATLIDVSRIGIGMLSGTDLEVGEALVLALPEHALKLVVSGKLPLPSQKQFRYGLTAADPAEDLEARLRASGSLAASDARAPVIPAVKTGRGVDYRAARYTIDWDLRVDAKTLGTKFCYQLLVANISRSGFLVTTFHKEIAPFLVNTLIDITVDPECKFLAHPVHGFAKVVRQLLEKDAASGSKKVSFGLVISEIFTEDKSTWESFMRTLEKDAEPYIE